MDDDYNEKDIAVSVFLNSVTEHYPSKGGLIDKFHHIIFSELKSISGLSLSFCRKRKLQVISLVRTSSVPILLLPVVSVHDALHHALLYGVSCRQHARHPHTVSHQQVLGEHLVDTRPQPAHHGYL